MTNGNLIVLAYNVDCWIGLTDEGHEGSWIWVSTGEEAVYTNWMPGQPNNYAGAANWARIYQGANGQWNDHNVNIRNSFICKG